MKRRVLLLAVPVSLVALLVTLAVLQYRWVGELSANERRRMDASVRASVASMARTLDDAIGGAVVALDVEPADLDALRAERVAARWAAWSASSAAPDLVRALYVVSAERGTGTLYRLDRDARSFVPVPWPAELSTLRTELQRDAARSSPVPRRWADGAAAAVVSRVVELPVYTTTTDVDISELVRRIRNEPGATLRGYTIVVLDVATLRGAILPTLVRRYMPDGAYRIALLRNGDARPLYVSAPGPLRDPDARATLFSGASPPMVFTPPVARHAAPVVVPAAHGSASAAQWQLVAVHRDGSVDAAVARTRVRNLVAGSSVLVVLAIGIAVVLVHAHTAEALLRQQIEFVSAMSHELRTPVAVVSTAADNLTRGVVESREQARGYGEVLSREARRLASMIEQVLEFARTRSTRRYARLPFDARDAVRAAIEATSVLAADARRTLAVDLPETPAIVTGDRDALSRAIQNLVANAVKYGGDEPRIEVSLARRDRTFCISVADRGPGIPPSERPHLTEPFFRGRRAVDEQIPGSGLGLALVQRIVIAHGGRLHIESGDGGGSRFTIELREAR